MALRQIDPYFNDVPWEIIYDDAGRPIGEVFLIPLKERMRFKIKRIVKLAK